MLILKIWILIVLISMIHIGDDKHHRMGRVCVCVGEGGVLVMFRELNDF